MNLTIYRNGEIQRHYPCIARCVLQSDGQLNVYILSDSGLFYKHEYSKEYYDWFELGDK